MEITQELIECIFLRVTGDTINSKMRTVPTSISLVKNADTNGLVAIESRCEEGYYLVDLKNLTEDKEILVKEREERLKIYLELKKEFG